ncbi:metallophosphoesterase [Hahella sp. SMD15-11]|uniref:Metallophosphoesterase n=1 Tax=Thermohahella caldifontis TaxID=3142973 RepID=A0AB39UYG8_9GAMM
MTGMPGATGLLDISQDHDVLLERYAPRMGWQTVVRRLAREQAAAGMLEGFDLPWFHVEQLVNLPRLLRFILRVSGLYQVGRNQGCRPEVVFHPVYHRKISPALDGVRILHLTDIHADMSEANLDAVIGMIRTLEYDAVVLTGDYRARTSGPWEAAAAGMKRLVSALRGPVVAVLGNHDPLVLGWALESMGVTVLMNEAVTLTLGNGHLALAGVDDGHYFETADIRHAFAQADSEHFCILLSHTPELYQQAAHVGVDVMLCGHTHGGQICLPGGVPIITESRCPRKLASGHWRWGGLEGYTSRGTGMSVLDVRLFCPPEIVIHELRSGMPP